MELSEIIVGEAGPLMFCGLQAYIAVAWVYQRNSTMYGVGEANDMSRFVAENWWLFEDPTDGATFLFSEKDLSRPAVKKLIENKGPPTVFKCRVGALYAY